MATRTDAARRLVSAAVGGALLAAPAAWAFDSRSDGSDGALDYTGTVSGTTVVFDPTDPATLGSAFDAGAHPDGLDEDADNIYQFTSITIPQGVTIRLLETNMRVRRAVYWLSQGPVTIDGTINLEGQQGHACGDLPTLASPGPGGWTGGAGGRTNSAAGLPGDGPGGGEGGFVSANNDSRHGVGGSHATAGGEDNAAPRPSAGPTYGNVYLVPLVGGSGGSGGAGEDPLDGFGGGGGAGGGAIMVAANDSIAFGTGSRITADGGNGRAGCSGGGLGGDGAGGSIHLLAPSITGPGALTAVGSGCGSCFNGGAGRIRVDQFGNDLSVSASPSAIRGFPVVVILPSAVVERTLRVVSLGGEAVPENPEGSFVNLPDVEISSADPVDLVVRGEGVPENVRPTIYIANADEQVQEIEGECLTTTVGDTTESTTSVTLAPGASQIFVRAVWDPDVTPVCE